MGSILFAVPFGYITGCVLHTVPATQNSFYSDVIALNTAAILAALFTSIWVWKDWRITQTDSLAYSGERPTTCYRQENISDSSALNLESRPPIKRHRGSSVTSKTPTFVAQRISDILDISLAQPNRTALMTAWSTQLLETAKKLWASGQIVLNISSRSNMIDSGFGDAASFSTLEDGTLHITTGFLPQLEIDSPAWQPLHAYL